MTDCNIHYKALTWNLDVTYYYFVDLMGCLCPAKYNIKYRMFIGKDNFSCSFLCYVETMDIIMF